MVEESVVINTKLIGEYVVIENGDLRAFVDEVNLHMSMGYMPIGGISISTCCEENGNIHIWYTQAMVNTYNGGLKLSVKGEAIGNN